VIVSDKLRESLTLRIPLWDNAENLVSPRQKIDQLETYTLLTAWMQGELAKERLESQEELAELERRWDHLEPVRIGSRKTNAAHEDAKRAFDPELYDHIKSHRETIAALSAEIERLERDAVKCSRVYTFISGT
jgi:chromosome segregation ATPase